MAGAESWLNWLERTADPDLDPAAIVAGLRDTLPRGERLATTPLVLYWPRVPERLRPEFIALLERAGGAEALPLLKAALRSPESNTRGAAAQALGELGGAAEAPDVEALLVNPAPSVRARAADAYAKLATPAQWMTWLDETARGLAPRPEARRLLARGAGRVARQLPDAAQERLSVVLADMLRAEDVEEAQLAAEGLGNLGGARAVAALLAIDERYRVGRAVAATRALSRRQTRASLVALRARLADPRVAVRATALVGLGLRGNARDVPSLEPLLASPGPWPLGPVAAFALATLVERGEAPAGSLCPGLTSKEPVTRRNAALSLRNHPSPDCAAPQVQREIGEPGRSRETRTPSWIALVMANGQILVSHADETGDAGVPGLPAVRTESPWRWPYRLR